MSNARFSILQARAISDKRVSDAQFRTLAALGMYADKNGWCYPSLKTLGKDLNKSAQAVGRDTISLRKLGYLQVKNRYDSKTKSRHSNLYRLIFDFNVDDSTLSTPDVDTLSTSDVEVNVPFNAPNKRGSYEPKTLQEAIFSGKPVTPEMLNNDAEKRDIANLIGTGMGVTARDASDIAFAFMKARDITIPQGKIKGQRKAIREMLDMKVKPEHVTQAVKDLMAKGMTVVDLYSVSKTAIDLANKPKTDDRSNILRTL